MFSVITIIYDFTDIFYRYILHYIILRGLYIILEHSPRAVCFTVRNTNSNNVIDSVYDATIEERLNSWYCRHYRMPILDGGEYIRGGGLMFENWCIGRHAALSKMYYTPFIDQIGYGAGTTNSFSPLSRTRNRTCSLKDPSMAVVAYPHRYHTQGTTTVREDFAKIQEVTGVRA